MKLQTLGRVVLSGLTVALIMTGGNASTAMARFYNGVSFVWDEHSFADEVVRFDPGYSGGAQPGWNDPQRVLGPPGPIPFTDLDHQPLGSGGLIELAFTDIVLTNSGTVGYPELYIGETQGTAEDVSISLRPSPETRAKLGEAFDSNHDGFYEMGRYVGDQYVGVFGFAIFLDIDQRFPGFAENQLAFDAVQIIDDPTLGSVVGATVGMDLESVGVFHGKALKIRGDFNSDFAVDNLDIELLSAAVRSGRNETSFEMTGDHFVNRDDQDEMVHAVLNTYYGDANLDGVFNTQDLVSVFTAGTYEDAITQNSTWTTGDWDGDLEFTSNDLVVAFQDGGYELGPRQAVRAVPEPSGGLASLIGSCVLLAWRRR